MKSSLTSAFDALFEGMRKTPYRPAFLLLEKPQIKRVSGEWQCKTHDGCLGFGARPDAAYRMWSANKALHMDRRFAAARMYAEGGLVPDKT